MITSAKSTIPARTYVALEVLACEMRHPYRPCSSSAWCAGRIAALHVGRDCDASSNGFEFIRQSEMLCGNHDCAVVMGRKKGA